MVLPGHIAGGYLVTRALLKLAGSSLSTSQNVALLIIGTLAGELPDIDLIWYYLEHRFSKNNGAQSHRNYITHAPTFWLILCLLIVFVGYVTTSTFTEWLGWIILAGTFSHFLLDSIEYGITWLWPFSKKEFCLYRLPEPHIHKRTGSFSYYFEYLTKYYVRSWTFVAEVLVVLIACGVFLLSAR